MLFASKIECLGVSYRILWLAFITSKMISHINNISGSYGSWRDTFQNVILCFICSRCLGIILQLFQRCYISQVTPICVENCSFVIPRSLSSTRLQFVWYSVVLVVQVSKFLTRFINIKKLAAKNVAQTIGHYLSCMKICSKIVHG